MLVKTLFIVENFIIYKNMQILMHYIQIKNNISDF